MMPERRARYHPEHHPVWLKNKTKTKKQNIIYNFKREYLEYKYKNIYKKFMWYCDLQYCQSFLFHGSHFNITRTTRSLASLYQCPPSHLTYYLSLQSTLNSVGKFSNSEYFATIFPYIPHRRLFFWLGIWLYLHT